MRRDLRRVDNPPVERVAQLRHMQDAELTVTQPLYTFGKIGHARSATKAGRDAEAALPKPKTPATSRSTRRWAC